jgi:hypothetical protein
MAVVAHVILRGVSREQYDQVRAEVGWLEEPPTGGISHLTWWEGADCHNVDSWETEQAFAAFGAERLGPGMAKAGIQVEPEVTFYPAHEVFMPRSVTITVLAKGGSPCSVSRLARRQARSRAFAC